MPIHGINNSCRESVWKKGDREYIETLEMVDYCIIDPESYEDEYDTFTINATTKFIEEYAGEIECAGFH